MATRLLPCRWSFGQEYQICGIISCKYSVIHSNIMYTRHVYLLFTEQLIHASSKQNKALQ